MACTATTDTEGYITLAWETPGEGLPDATLVSRRPMEEMVRKVNALHALGIVTQADMIEPDRPSNPFSYRAYTQPEIDDDPRCEMDNCKCDVCEITVGDYLEVDSEGLYDVGRSRLFFWHPQLILCEDCLSMLPKG